MSVSDRKLQLPARVSIKDREGKRVTGIFHFADDETGMSGKTRVMAPDGKMEKCVYLFEFPAIGGEDESRYFTRPTSAEQYVKQSATGKGWNFVDAEFEDRKGNKTYISLKRIRDGPGFTNDPSFTRSDRDAMVQKAKSQYRPKRKREGGFPINKIAKALCDVGVMMDDDKWDEFVRLLGSCDP